MFTLWASVILVGIAAIFAYHVGLGWRTGVVRFPMSVLVFQEFEREQSPENFWGIMALDGAVSILALIASSFVAWGELPFSNRPVDRLQSLNGCYEVQGLPDFMRPRDHWTFRISDGRITDRAGNAVSIISLHNDAREEALVSFSPVSALHLKNTKSAQSNVATR